MDDTKIDESIAAKEEKIRVIDKKVVELTDQKKKLMNSIHSLREKKTARFSRQLLDGLRKNGVPLNQETLQSLLSATQAEGDERQEERSGEIGKILEDEKVNSPETPADETGGNRLFSSAHDFGG